MRSRKILPIVTNSTGITDTNNITKNNGVNISLSSRIEEPTSNLGDEHNIDNHTDRQEQSDPDGIFVISSEITYLANSQQVPSENILENVCNVKASAWCAFTLVSDIILGGIVTSITTLIPQHNEV